MQVTGTRAQTGCFQDADRGTLFLDEIGDTPAEIQAKLLRALMGDVIPEGGNTPVRVDVRHVFATDADLGARVRQGRFHKALQGRIEEGVRIDVPPLRDRRGDALLLFVHFLKHVLECTDLLTFATGSTHCWMPAPAIVALARYDWPKNIRELRGVVNTAAADPRVPRSPATAPQTAEAFHRVAYAAALRVAGTLAPIEEVGNRPEDILADRLQLLNDMTAPVDERRRALCSTLDEHDWKIIPAARAIGMARSTFKRRMDDLSVEQPDLIDAATLQDQAGRAASMEDLARRLGVWTEKGVLRVLDLRRKDLPSEYRLPWQA